MRNKIGLNNILSANRKTLYIVLSIVMVMIFTLTVAYAALSTTLNINGNAEVGAASWDIYLDNIVLNSKSATANLPTIVDKTTVSFSTTLSKPGDFYEFSIDVVNNGTIDAMINSISKTPELSDTQKKYLNYIVEYQNGESITTNQLIAKNSFVRLKVKVEYRNDLTASDLPTASETLNLSFKVNYVQSDGSEDNVTIDNNGKLIKVVSGDGTNVGDEICIGAECFYVISNDEENVTMLAKYNLYVGGIYNNSSWTAYGEEATGRQDSTMKGWVLSGSHNGTTNFSSTNYWDDGSALKNEYGTSYPAYVYNSSSALYNYVENYKTYLTSQGAIIEEARLISFDDLEALGCSGTSCESEPEWLYETSYWLGVAKNNNSIYSICVDGEFYLSGYSNFGSEGVRPVIVIKSLF